MMRYSSSRYPRGNAAVAPRRNRFDGYQFSLPAPPETRSKQLRFDIGEVYTVRAVAPSLRPLVARTGSRCPECAGPLVSGEGCVACPVCGFCRQGR